MPDLIATKPFPYAGKNRNVGDRFEAKSRDARLLIAIRKARLATDDDVIEPAVPVEIKAKALVAEEPSNEDRPKRVYRRRDIVVASETK
jgi:hypothetical protein